MSNSTSNEDLNNLILALNLKPFYAGTYSRDDLPSKLINNKFYIINLDGKNGLGTHWTTFFYNQNRSYYFDSYGFPPPLEVENKIKPYTYNKMDIQNINSTACGYYCIAFIYYLHGELFYRDEAFHRFIDIFKRKTSYNDQILYKLLNAKF